MEDNPIQAYYSTLPIPQDTQSIRLLHINAPVSEEGFDDPVRCHLSVEVLGTKPYAALSYVWGTMAPRPDTIDCSGVALPVSSNCLSALRHLRAKLGAFSIWIDAVCINQIDRSEKAQQIPLMGDIYHHATATYIWLSESSPAKERAIEYMLRAGFVEYYFNFRAISAEDELKPRPWAALLHHSIYRWSYAKSPIPYDSTKPPWSRRIRKDGGPGASIQDIDELLDTIWTSRIWTYQEAALARNPTIVCGTSHVGWSRFAFSTIFLSSISGSTYLHRWIEVISTRALCQAQIDTNDDFSKHMQLYWEFCRSIGELRSLFISIYFIVSIASTIVSFLGVGLWIGISARGHWRDFAWLIGAFLLSFLVMVLTHLVSAEAPSGSIFSQSWSPVSIFLNSQLDIHRLILDTLANRAATQSSDMSFGLHNVLQQFTESKRSALRVDYAMSAEDAYQELTSYLILQPKSLAPLVLAASKSRLGAPSWVPDYSQTLWSLEGVGDISKIRNSASGRSQPYCRISDHPVPDTLVVKGFQTDVIANIAHFHRTSLPYDALDNSLHQENLDLLFKWYYHSFQMPRLVHKINFFARYSRPKPSILERIIASANLPIKSSSVRTYLQLLGSAYSLLLFRGLTDTARVKLATKKVWRLLTSTGLLSHHELLDTHIQISNALAQKEMKVFETANGYVGYGFGDLKENDRVYLISGFSLPLVMRKAGLTVRIVSTGYFGDLGEETTTAKSDWLGKLGIRKKHVQLPFVHIGRVWELYMREFRGQIGAVTHQIEDAPGTQAESGADIPLEDRLPDVFIS